MTAVENRLLGQIPDGHKDEVIAICKGVAASTAASISALLSHVADDIEHGRRPPADAAVVLRGLVATIEGSNWDTIIAAAASPRSWQ